MTGSEGLGDMMRMVTKMMETGKGMGSQMMVEMMPKCLKMMLPGVPKEKRADFVVKMVSTMMEGGSDGMTEEERRDFAAKVAEAVKT